MVQIRDARPDDAPGIACVHVETWRATYTGMLPAAYLGSMDVRHHASRWRRTIATGETATLVAEQGGEVVGFAECGETRADVPYTGELFMLYLAPAFQGRGIGGRLFDAASQCLRERHHCSLMLWVLRANPSRGFYEALGGKAFARRREMVGGAPVATLGYGWADLDRLLRRRGSADAA